MIDNKLYELRRRAMNHIYRARAISEQELPWIKIRILELKQNIAGTAFIGNDTVHLSANMANWSDNKLKQIIFHELAHVYFRADHTRTTTLMHPMYHDMTGQQIEKDFIAISKGDKKFPKC